MPSTRETALQALFELVGGAVVAYGAAAFRSEPLPVRIDAKGVALFYDGDPGAPDIELSPLTYLYQHRAEIDVVVQSGTASNRDALFDALLQILGGAIEQNRTLGGVCDWIEAEAPQPTNLPIEGAAGLKAATIPVVLHYATTTPL